MVRIIVKAVFGIKIRVKKSYENFRCNIFSKTMIEGIFGLFTSNVNLEMNL